MSTGLVLNHRYRLLERLATGGMGEVWHGYDSSLGRPVAVKLLRMELGADASARVRFESEALFAAGLQHTGIAQVYDFGEQDGRTYLVMELVPGEPLDKILARGGGLPVEAVLDLIVQVGRALTVAHDAGIVHRDVKPANLMVAPDGTLKITDFGIARRLAAASQTATGMVMGTAHYISPEQASGRQVSPAADLYSLGVVAYECLTGTPPFHGRTPVEIALKHVRDAPPPLPARVPAEARTLITQMLAKDPLNRPPDAGTVADRALALRAALSTGWSARGAPAPDPGDAAAAGPTGRTSVLPRFDDGAEDDLGTGLGGRPSGAPGQRRTARRRPAVTRTSVAAGLLIVGALVVGSLWKGPAFAGSGRDERDPPQAPVTSRAGEDATDDPARPSTPAKRRAKSPAPAVTGRYRTHRIRPSTPGTRSASPSQKPIRKPSRAGSQRPRSDPETDGEHHDSVNSEPGSPSHAEREARFGGQGVDVRGKVHI